MAVTAGGDTRAGRAHSNLVLVIVCAAQFMVVLDVSIVNVALPSIRADLGFSDQGLQWVVNAYTLAFAGFLLLGGRAADLFGRRRVFVLGLGLFSLASLVGALAGGQAMLIAARAAQGLGAAVVAPTTLSILAASFSEGRERNRALGVWGSMAGAGGSVGVLAGGLLTDTLGWPWIFFVNVPVGLTIALLALRHVDEGSAPERRQFDLLGAVLVTAGLVVLVHGIVGAEAHGWWSAPTVAEFAAAAALLAAFVLVEGRLRHPLVPLRVFRSRTLTGASLVVLLLGSGMFSMWFFLSLYLQQVLGYSALHAGLAFLPMSLAIVVAASAASRVVTRIGVLPVAVTGLVTAATGLWLFTSLPVEGSLVREVLPRSVVVACGFGCSLVPVTIAGLSGTSNADSGLASGLLNTSRLVGGALGLAVLTTVAATRTRAALPTGHPSPAAAHLALLTGYRGAFGFCALLILAAAAAALVLLRGPAARA